MIYLTWGHNHEKKNKLLEAGVESSDITCEDNGIQDFNSTPIMVGGDVVGLYPNMDIVATAELSARAFMESKVQCTGVDYKLLAVYLFLVWVERQ